MNLTILCLRDCTAQLIASSRPGSGEKGIGTMYPWLQCRHILEFQFQDYPWWWGCVRSKKIAAAHCSATGGFTQGHDID